MELDGGRGSVVRPALVLSTVTGGDGLQEEGDHGHLGLVHQQAHSGLVGGHLGPEFYTLTPEIQVRSQLLLALSYAI